MAFYRAPGRRDGGEAARGPCGAEDPAKMPGLGSMQGGAMESALRDLEASWPAPPQDYSGIDLQPPYVMLLRDYCLHIQESRCRWLPGASMENPHVHLGSARKMDAAQARKKARQMKAEALGMQGE